MRTLLLAGVALCLAAAASGQVLVLSVSCSMTAGPTTAGAMYSSTCTAMGGIAPYSWSISSGMLPAGLTLTPSMDTTMATVAGIPTTAGSYNFTVQVTDSTPPPLGPLTGTQSFSGTVAPNITSILPTSTTAGQPGLTLTVNGFGFGMDSVVNFNATALTTTPVSSNQVTASIPAGLLTLAGTATITLTSGGATSNGVAFPVSPTVTSLSPSSATAGGPSFTLTVNGMGFQAGATVSFNGSTLGTTVANPTQLTASVSASLITTAGTYPVSVTSGGLASNSVNFTVVPAPSISSIMPTSTPVGSAAFTLTVNGSNFGGDSVVHFNGTALSTTIVSANQLTASVPANSVASTGTFPVTVTSGGVTSNSVNFTVAAPAITSINPATVTAGGASFLLTVDGSNFVSGSVVQWTVSGATTTLSTNYLSSAEVTASVPSSLIAAPGSAQITVKTNSTTAGAVTLTIVAGPALSGLNPDTITAGSASFTLIASGTGFASGAAVQWTASGTTTPLSTTFQSANEVDATVPANLVASVGSAQVSVLSGGVTSNSLTFTIVAAPTISSLNPNTITAGSSAFTMTVTGSGFASGAQVKWNGSALGTVFVSSTELTATVLASDVASPGTDHVTVTSGGVTSNTVNFTVVTGPAVTSLSPTTATAGTGAFTLTVNGTGFASGAMVLWNNAALTTTFKSATQLTASVPASDIASPATVSVSVKSGGVTSNSLSFAVIAGASIASLSPTTITGGTGAGLGPVGSCPSSVSPAGSLTINGAGFTSGATAAWNGTSLMTTFVNSTQLTACVPSYLIQGYGTAAITVTSGGTTTAAAQIQLAFPAISITGLQTTAQPTQQLPIGVQLSSALAKNGQNSVLQGTLALSFTPNAAGVSAGYADAGLQFSSGGTTLNFTLPAGATSVTAGMLQQGTVAGTITVTLTTLTFAGVDVLPQPAPTASVVIPPLAPVITPGSVQITNVTSTGFDVVVTGYSTPREMNTATFSFTAAAGTAFTGTTTFAVDVSSAFSGWYSNASSQPEGSLFLLTVPFTISGPTSVLGSVSVTLTNSVGTSAPESASQ